MTRLGATAEATKEQTAEATSEVRALAQEYALPVEQVLLGLEALVAQGNTLSESLAMLRPVAAAAQASGAAVEDMAKSGGALTTNLKVQSGQLLTAFDFLAKAGKEGMFELKDMAQYLPALAAAWAAVGNSGVDSLIDLSAALQIVRKQTGTSENAFNGVRDLLAKVYSPDVQRNFKDVGIDLEKAMKKGVAAGKPLLDVLIEVTRKATGGDLAQLPKFFGEIDSRTAIRALIQLQDEFDELRRSIRETAPGTVARDLSPVVADAQASIDRLANAWTAASIAVGKFTAEATPAIKVLEGIGHMLDLWRGDPEARRKEQQRAAAPTPFDKFVARTRDERHRRERDDKIKEIEGGLAAGRYLTARPGPNWPSEREHYEKLVAQLRQERDSEESARQAARAQLERAGQMFGYQAGAGPGEAAQRSMEGVTAAIHAEGEKAVSAAQEYAQRIRQMFDFTATPTISPRFQAPAGSAPSGGAPA
ncbi:MAG: phage tail tape measure protein, partial [Methylacidiphilales bacterium]|nr:phage tail tape measure protein [Candidatus Methylacidiphilales bacterium]